MEYLTIHMECRYLKPLRELPVYNIQHLPGKRGYWCEVGCFGVDEHAKAEAELVRYKRRGITMSIVKKKLE